MKTTMTSKWWLFLGVALVASAHMRFGVGALAWAAPLPLLGWLRRNHGVRARVLFGVALFGAYTLAVAKICTDPLPLLFAPAFAAPTALLALLGYLAWDQARRSGPGWVAPLVFAATTVTGEYVQHRYTPFGSWGAVAYTQLENLALLQVAALVGLAGVSFIVSFVAASLEQALAEPEARVARLAPAAALTAAALIFGALRLGSVAGGETVAVAAIGTSSTFAGWPYGSADERERVNQGLFARTAEAAAKGARVVGWTEAATLVLHDEEPAFVRRVGEAAAANRVDLVAAYVVPNDAARTYENKLVWARPDGTINHTYHKHHPVPGEPARAGTEPPQIVETAAGRATAALCYDYDFPAHALESARKGLDLAVVPSSDWRGIDPIHTQMASLRAIENGFSLLRPTRWGLTAAFDPWGRVRAWESSFDSSEQVVIAAVPRHGVRTLYTAIGDIFVALCACFAAVALGASARKHDWTPARAAS